MMGRTSRHKLWIPKFLTQNGRFVATWFLSYCLALVVACSFMSQHIFMLSSLILSQHNLTLSRHSYVDVVCFMSRHSSVMLSVLCHDMVVFVAT